MKYLVLILAFTTSSFLFCQSDFSIGIEITPSIKLQTIRNKTTGLFSSISGYGFNIGLPVKFKLEDLKTISTGLSYEFTAFDVRNNTVLVNSLRLNAINIPVVYNYPITENYYLNIGGGVNYIFTSKQYGGGVWLNMNPIVNQLQPYLSLGGSLLKHKSDNTYELGIAARYHLFNLWTLNTTTSTNIVSLDLNLKYFFN